MKKQLGKIVLICMLTLNLFGASVNISLSAPAVYKGDSVSFTIRAQGGSVSFPDITEIEGFSVYPSGTSSTYTNINGKSSKSIAKTYTFKPTKDVTIPPFEIKIDGQTFKTEAKKVTILKAQASKSGDPFILKLNLDKQSLKVGESTTLKIIYKQRVGARVDRVRISEPKIDNFWVKKVGKPKEYTQGEYMVQEYSYLIFAQKSGTFHIEPIVANIGRVVRRQIGNGFFNDPFFNSISSQLEWKNIYSNGLDIKVEPLPNGLELYGDFNISASVDKREVYANKPVNLTIRVEGVGNIDDIQKFDLNIENAVIYADKPVIKTYFKNGTYQGVFSQKIAIIADRDFTIPPIKLTFFDKQSKSVKSIQTDAIKVKVKGATAATQKPKIESAQKPKVESIETPKQRVVIQKENAYLKYLFFIIGVFVGALGVYLARKTKSNKKSKRESDIIKRIKNTKDDKKLFDILLPYANEDRAISETLKELEENIYKKGSNRIDKQRLYDYFLDKE